MRTAAEGTAAAAAGAPTWVLDIAAASCDVPDGCNDGFGGAATAPTACRSAAAVANPAVRFALRSAAAAESHSGSAASPPPPPPPPLMSSSSS